MDTEAKLSLLKKIYIFSELKDENLKDILGLCTENEYTKSKQIVSENSPGDSLHIVMKGTVKVTVVSYDGKEVILSTLSEGDFFGEMSLLDGALRSANVVAIDNVRTLTLSREVFLRKILPVPEIAAAILAVMSKRLRDANRKYVSHISMDVFDRLAFYFKKEADHKGRELLDGSIVFERLPQNDIASIIGSSRETVTRMIKEMVEKKYLLVSGKSIILRKDFEKKLSERHIEEH